MSTTVGTVIGLVGVVVGILGIAIGCKQYTAAKMNTAEAADYAHRHTLWLARAQRQASPQERIRHPGGKEVPAAPPSPSYSPSSKLVAWICNRFTRQ